MKNNELQDGWNVESYENRKYVDWLLGNNGCEMKEWMCKFITDGN